MEYSYSFSNELQQDWQWPERYGTQPEILKYLNHVAERFDLMRDVQLNTRLKSALFDRDANLWTLTTDDGAVISAPYCIMATGNLSTPQVPKFEGLEDFEGKWYPHRPLAAGGRRFHWLAGRCRRDGLVPACR